EQWAADRARGLDEGWVDPHRHDARNEAEIGVARAELAAFDAAHPHIAAELAALQSAAANRAMHA
ncbi:hypothetical protein, partial [Frankia sp. EI5c]|uniref:hypothetical protein n=1 Tax=Frankia sp. EI5c TaxID=683316 RepID=UPI001A7E2377